MVKGPQAVLWPLAVGPNDAMLLGLATVYGHRSRELAIVVERSVDVVIGSAELVRCEERLRSDDRVSEVWRAMVSECRRDGRLRTIWHHCVRESLSGSSASYRSCVSPVPSSSAAASMGSVGWM